MTDNELAYRKVLKMERDRSRSRRRYRKGMFQENMLHLEHYLDFQDVENDEDDPRNAWISDKDAGAEKIRSFDERRDGSHYTRRIKVARVVLSRKFPDLIEVFNLVVKNGSNRRESIAELASHRKLDRKAANDLYWKHLKKISFFFHAQ